MIGDVLIKIGRILIYLPVNSIKICVKIIYFLKNDTRRLIVFISLIGIVAFSRYLVNRATKIRILKELKSKSAFEY